MQGPSPRPADGSRIACGSDGWPRQGRTAAAGDVLAAVLLAVAPEAEKRAHAAEAAAEHAADAAETRADTVAELRRLAGDRGAVARLLAMPDDLGCAQLLALMRVDDRAPRRRAGRARQVAQLLGTAKLLAIAVDVLLGRPRNLAAVVLQRIDRVARGQDPQTHSRRSWSLQALLEAAAGGAVTAAGRVMPQRDHNPHRQMATATAADAAQIGNWPRVDDLVRRHDLDLQAIADRSGVHAHELQRHLTDLANQRRAAFAAAMTA